MEIKKIRNKRKKVNENSLKKWMIRKEKIYFWKEREKDQITIPKKMKNEIIFVIQQKNMGEIK